MKIVLNFSLIIIVGLFLVSPSETYASESFLLNGDYTDEEKIKRSRENYQQYVQNVPCPSTGSTIGPCPNSLNNGRHLDFYGEDDYYYDDDDHQGRDNHQGHDDHDDD